MDSNYNEISIYEYYKTINTNRSILLKINATVLIVTLILLLVLPNVYRSEAIIIPPLDNNSLGLMNILNEIPFDIGVSDNESEIYTYVAIIKSRTLIGKIVKDYNLIEYYGVDNIEDAIKELRGNINIELTDEGIF
ncbi:MAG: hypothetical protein H6629_11865 [Calditrichae bacterium]|nr:hypothetical protein [Calditrichia bacterium]